MAIEDYREYKRKQTSSRSNTPNRSTRATSSGRKASSTRSTSRTNSSATNRKRPTSTVVKKRKRLKKYKLTEEGKKFFRNLGIFAGVGVLGVAGMMGLFDGVDGGNAKAEATTPTGLYADDTRQETADDVLNNILGTGAIEPETSASPDTYVSSFDGEKYNFCSEEYALELAQDAIDNVNELFGGAGMNPLVPGSEEYLPEYFDKYMLAGLAYTESTLRYSEADGDPLYSSVKARGMCQCKEETLEYIKWYAKSVLGVELDYKFEDLDNPRVSMEVAAIVLATNAENYFKPTRKSNAFAQGGLNFSPELQKSMLLTSYNAGGQGVVNRLLESGATSSNYAKTIMQYEDLLREKYSELQR